MPAFRDKASFGKRVEFWVIAQMLKEGLDVYIPLVDDQGIDALVRRQDGTCAAVQIKARSKECKIDNAAVFTLDDRHCGRDDYWFVFRSEQLDATWILSSEEFKKEATSVKEGKGWEIKFNGVKTQSGKRQATYPPDKKERYGKYERPYSHILDGAAAR